MNKYLPKAAVICGELKSTGIYTAAFQKLIVNVMAVRSQLSSSSHQNDFLFEQLSLDKNTPGCVSESLVF